MSIEAMKQVIELYDTHCYNNDYGGIEFNKKHGYKFIEAIEALRTTIQQAEAKTDEPVAYMWQHDETGRTGFVEADQLAMGWRDANPRLKIAAPCYTHPAPGVPDDVVLDAERYRWLRENGTLGFSGAPSWRASVSFDAVDAYAQTLDANIDAAQAQKGQQ